MGSSLGNAAFSMVTPQHERSQVVIWVRRVLHYIYTLVRDVISPGRCRHIHLCSKVLQSFLIDRKTRSLLSGPRRSMRSEIYSAAREGSTAASTNNLRWLCSTYSRSADSISKRFCWTRVSGDMAGQSRFRRGENEGQVERADKGGFFYYSKPSL